MAICDPPCGMRRSWPHLSRLAGPQTTATRVMKPPLNPLANPAGIVDGGLPSLLYAGRARPVATEYVNPPSQPKRARLVSRARAHSELAPHAPTVAITVSLHGPKSECRKREFV